MVTVFGGTVESYGGSIKNKDGDTISGMNHALDGKTWSGDGTFSFP